MKAESESYLLAGHGLMSLLKHIGKCPPLSQREYSVKGVFAECFLFCFPMYLCTTKR